MNNVPTLRFKEFSGEWSLYKLKAISDVRDGTHDSPKYVNEGYPLITSKNLMENGKIDFTDISYITEEDYININKRSKVDVGDILFGMIGTIGNPVIVEKDGFAIKNVALIKEKDKLMNKFLIQVLKSSVINKQFYRLNTGGTQKFIGLGIIRDLEVRTPSIEEQEKIASFFSLMDKKIELQTEKVKELKNYKKGIMQKIFSQELRFKDENGNEYPEWEEVNLRKILKEVSEKTTVINQYEVISSTNSGLYLQKDYFSREIASKDNIGYKILKRNQVVISPQNLWMGNINLNSKYDIGMVSPSYKIFDIKSEFDSSYIGFVLRTERAFYEYKQASEQGASIVRRNLNMDLFYDIRFKLPCKAEQYKISKFINKIDCKIEQEMKKLNSLNQYKKGLLQQMFI